MPLLRRQPFEKEEPPIDLEPSDEVFHCKATDEVFCDYEQFFERVILCNSLVWSCEITGKSGLTYQEALDSEKKSHKQISTFPESLQKPVLHLASLCCQRRLNDMNEDIYTYVKGRFFVGEQVNVLQKDERKSCKVIKAIAPESTQKKEKDADSVICLDSSEDEDDKPLSKLREAENGIIPNLGPDASEFQYLVHDKKLTDIYMVTADSMSRKKGVLTREKCKIFLKIHCESSDRHSIWTVKDSSSKKLRLGENKFEDYFDGPQPIFAASKPRKQTGPKSGSSSCIDLTEDNEIARAKAERKERKRNEKEMRKLKKKLKEKKQEQSVQPKPVLSSKTSPISVEKPIKLSPEEMLQMREQMKMEREASRRAKKEEAKRIQEEEKLKKKEERLKEREMKKAEKQQRDEYLRQWNMPRDDLECDDLKDLPLPTPVTCGLDSEHFGDAVLILEYIHTFKTLLDIEDRFPNGISLDELVRCLNTNEVNSVYYDLLSLLLKTIFNLQVEEEEEEEELEAEGDVKSAMPEGFGKGDYTDLVMQATSAALLPQKHYATSLRQLPMDPQTITEVLRLHIIGSGSRGSEGSSKFRYQQRGAYTSCDDPGLDFRKYESGILKFLEKMNVFDLSPRDKLKILAFLIQQQLTYAACRDHIEEAFEKLRLTKQELRQLQQTEQRRDREEQTFWYKKKLEERARERELEAQRKEQKKKEREEKLRADENKDLNTQEDVAMDVSKQTESKESDEDKEIKKQEEIESSRKSARQKAVKEKSMDPLDLLVENLDWENVTAEEKDRLKTGVLKKEQDLLDQVQQMQHGFAIYPLGRDRTFRRYWVFRSVPGVFVEDNEDYIPEDFLQCVIDQKLDEKSAGSDKENESFDDGKKAFSTVLSENPLAVSSLDNKTETVSTEEEKLEVMDTVQENKMPASQSVNEQIQCRGTSCWSFFQSEAELEHLMDSLNPRGFREGPLRQALCDQKQLLSDALSNCPQHLLRFDNAHGNHDKTVKYQNVRNRNKVTQGAVKNASAQEFLELNLREICLDIEERLHVGTLGQLKVKKRELWRCALEEGSYDSQCDDLPSSPSKLKCDSLRNGVCKIENEDTPMDTDSTSEGNYFVVPDLARALLQIGRGIDPKYLNPPLGEGDTKKKSKQKVVIEKIFQNMRKKAKQCDNDDSDDCSDSDSTDQTKKTPMEAWEESLQSSTSLPQIFLHLAVLEGCVTWTKSALNAHCRICRRKGDGEHMLLCDGCDRGHHMYCLKPPVKNIPRGDWFCIDCRPKDVLRTPRKRRLSTMLEESEDEDSDTEASSDSESEASEENESQEEDSDDDDTSDESSDDSDDSSSGSSEEETSPQPAKIKLLKGMGRKRPQSARSTATSVTNGRSRSSGAITQSIKNKNKATESTKNTRTRHSLESSQPSRTKTRNSLEKSVKTRNGTETSKPIKSSRRSLPLENNFRGKKSTSRRSSSEHEDAPDAKRLALAVSRSRGGENVLVMKKCEDLVIELSQRQEAWPFLKPVSRKDAPDYLDHVKKPMDFSTMRNKINKFEYSEPEPLLADIRVIFKNCTDYNMPTAPEYQAGQKMNRLFDKRCRELKIAHLLEKPKPAAKHGSSPKTSPSPKKSSPARGRSLRGKS